MIEKESYPQVVIELSTSYDSEPKTGHIEPQPGHIEAIPGHIEGLPP